jgi:hypothetical protein
MASTTVIEGEPRTIVSWLVDCDRLAARRMAWTKAGTAARIRADRETFQPAHRSKPCLEPAGSASTALSARCSLLWIGEGTHSSRTRGQTGARSVATSLGTGVPRRS